MKVSIKVIAAIAVVAALAVALLMAQKSSSSAKKINLTAQDMELLVSDIMPPAQQQQLATNPDQKKMIAQQLKKLLAIGQVAEQEGYADRPEVKSRIALQNEISLREAYLKKNPEFKVSDEDVEAYHQQNPTEFSTFLEANPRFKQAAQGPQGEMLRKEFGQIKLLSDRARKEGLDQTQEAKLRTLIDRNQVLAQSYIDDLRNSDKLVTDADIEQYYGEHPDEFQEAKVRHILISTEPAGGEEDDGHGHGAGSKGDKKEPEKKGMTKEQARQKALALRERVLKGEDFSKLAKENSDDPGSKDNGGLYDFFARGRMVPAFDNAAFTLKPGDVSEPVETEFGYHIIKVEERRAAPLDNQETRERIREKLKAEKLEKRIDEIANSSTVQVAEDFNVTPKPEAQSPMLPPGHPGSR